MLTTTLTLTFLLFAAVALVARRAGRPALGVLGWGLTAAAALGAPSAAVLALELPPAGNLFLVLVQLCWATVLSFVALRFAARARGVAKPRGLGYLEAAGGLAILLLGAAGTELLVTGQLVPLGTAFVVAAGLLLAVVVWRTPVKAIIKYLASAEAASMVLSAILLATVAGTVVLQGLSAADLTATYGDLAVVLLALGIDDIFHSGALVTCLGLLALTSTVTVYHRRKSIVKWRHMGLLMSHVAVVAILVGGMIGWVYGSKGMLHLEIGQSGSTYRLDPTAEHPRGQMVDLGFEVRLDHFELDNYVPEYKLYQYEKNPEGEGFATVQAEAPEAGVELALPGGATGNSLTVEKTWKRLVTEQVWVEDATNGPARPAARVTLTEAGHERRSWLAAGQSSLAGYRDATGRFDLVLSWDEPDAATLKRLAGTTGEAPHRIVSAGGAALDVRPGGQYTLPGGKTLLVRGFYPDFTFDIENRRAATRSQEPRNPALEVVVLEPGVDVAAAATTKPTFLYANAELQKMMAGQHGGADDLRYQHIGGAGGSDRVVLVVGATAERLVLTGNEVAERGPVSWGEPFALLGAGGPTVAIEAPLRRAKQDLVRREAAEGPLNPAVDVVITTPTGQTSRVTMLGTQPKPVWLDPDHPVVFKEKPDGIKNFLSTLSIVEGGQVVETRTIRVNHPLTWRGHDLYQANYDPKNPKYSGIQIVHDPGLWVVEWALWLLMLGVLHTVALRSWKPVWRRARRRSTPRPHGDPSEVPA